MTVGNANFDELLSTTLNNHRANMEIQFQTARPVVNYLFDRKRTRDVTGGVNIVEPLMYGQNTTFGSYSRYEQLDVTPQDGISAALYTWRQAALSIVIDGLSEVQNDGDAAIINLLETKVKQGQESLHEGFDIMLLADSAGNSGKDFDGIGLLVSATGTIGGIVSTDTGNSWWKSGVTAVGGAWGINKWRTSYNTASRGTADAPDFIVTTQTLFEAYEGSLVPAMRFQSKNTADLSFEHLMYKGAVVNYDVNITAGDTFMLNGKYITLAKSSKKWFKQTPFKTPVDGDWKVAQILFAGNLVTSNRSKHARLTGQTA